MGANYTPFSNTEDYHIKNIRLSSTSECRHCKDDNYRRKIESVGYGGKQKKPVSSLDDAILQVTKKPS